MSNLVFLPEGWDIFNKAFDIWRNYALKNKLFSHCRTSLLIGEALLTGHKSSV